MLEDEREDESADLNFPFSALALNLRNEDDLGSVPGSGSAGVGSAAKSLLAFEVVLTGATLVS